MPDGNPTRVVQLLVALALITAVFVALGWGYLLLFIAILFAIVMLHEFGHFVTAKRAGMKVTEYFVGFGPRLWSVRRGETEYGVKAIPAGGYVRITGFTSTEEVAAGGRAPGLPPAAVPPAHHRGVGRLGHALPHRLRARAHPGLHLREADEQLHGGLARALARPARRRPPWPA